MAFRNPFARKRQPIQREPCGCPTSSFGEPSEGWRSIHTDPQDTESDAWRQLLDLIDDTAEHGGTDFIPARELGGELYSQIVTLPTTIERLDRVTHLVLYGSNLRSIPPQIGEMTALQVFDPYTSYRLHWLPYEIVHCSALHDSRVSTRALYGNWKNRLPFPQLPSTVPPESIPDRCSVCRTTHPSTELTPWWISLEVATDVLPLLAHICSSRCLDRLGTPPDGYVAGPHQGGDQLVQPE